MRCDVCTLNHILRLLQPGHCGHTDKDPGSVFALAIRSPASLRHRAGWWGPQHTTSTPRTIVFRTSSPPRPRLTSVQCPVTGGRHTWRVLGGQVTLFAQLRHKSKVQLSLQFSAVSLDWRQWSVLYYFSGLMEKSKVRGVALEPGSGGLSWESVRC